MGKSSALCVSPNRTRSNSGATPLGFSHEVQSKPERRALCRCPVLSGRVPPRKRRRVLRPNFRRPSILDSPPTKCCNALCESGSRIVAHIALRTIFFERPPAGAEAPFERTFPMTHNPMTQKPMNQACVDACNACADACDHCAVSCLQETDAHMMARCIALDMDCAAMCRLAAGFMARRSEFMTQVCKMCAEICNACGEECAKHSMEHCQACARACHVCAQELEKMTD